MNQITFYNTVPFGDFIGNLFGLVLGALWIHTYFFGGYVRPGLGSCFLGKGKIFTIILGIFLGGFFLSSIVSDLAHNAKTKKVILFTLTDAGVVLPKKTEHESLIIPWNSILQIQREDYKRSKTHYDKLKFYYSVDSTKKPQVASINLHYLGVCDFDLFSRIRKFYTGLIVKEYAKGNFKILKGLTSYDPIWENYTPLSMLKS